MSNLAISETKEEFPCISKNVMQPHVSKDHIRVLMYQLHHSFPVEVNLFSSHAAALRFMDNLMISCYRSTPAIRYLCGNINPKHDMKTSSMYWTIQMISGYNTDMAFHDFQMIYSMLCSMSSLKLTKVVEACKQSEIYCGHMPPWNETCPCVSVQMILTLYDLTSDTQLSMNYYCSRTTSHPVFVHIYETNTNQWNLGDVYNMYDDLYINIYIKQTKVINFKRNNQQKGMG